MWYWWAISKGEWRFFQDWSDARNFAGPTGYVFGTPLLANVWLARRNAKNWLKTGRKERRVFQELG